MTCPNCSIEPGGIIEVDENGCCTDCGGPVDCPAEEIHKSWDSYFMRICHTVASKSHCLSRQIGAVIVRDNLIVSTGYCGPARGYPHCEGPTCPRQLKEGYKSGENLDICPSGHAEANAIANAARLGVGVSEATLYLNCLIPCKDCMILIVNAGISTVVPKTCEPYHKMSLAIARHGNVNIRRMKK